MYKLLLTQKKNVVHSVPVACRNLKNSKLNGGCGRNIHIEQKTHEVIVHLLRDTRLLGMERSLHPVVQSPPILEYDKMI